MNKYTSMLFVSAAVVVGLSGMARADYTAVRTQSDVSGKAVRAASLPHTQRSLDATQRRVPSPNMMALAKPQSPCNTIACGGYVMIGVGF